jgi:hypothetical protein
MTSWNCVVLLLVAIFSLVSSERYIYLFDTFAKCKSYEINYSVDWVSESCVPLWKDKSYSARIQCVSSSIFNFSLTHSSSCDISNPMQIAPYNCPVITYGNTTVFVGSTEAICGNWAPPPSNELSAAEIAGVTIGTIIGVSIVAVLVPVLLSVCCGVVLCKYLQKIAKPRDTTKIAIEPQTETERKQHRARLKLERLKAEEKEVWGDAE